MPGQKSFAQSLHDSFEFDHGSSSSTSSMNQQVLWNNMVFNPAEVERMTDRIASSGEANMPCLGNQDGGQLNIWSSSGSTPSQHYQHEGPEENKWDYGWTPSGTSTSHSGLRIEENHFEGSHMLSLDSHSRTQIDGSRSFLQNDSLFNNMHHDTEHAAVRVGIGNELSDSRLSHHPYTLGFLDSESVPSSLDLSIPSDNSENVGLLREDDERLESSVDGRRISCKRKNSEGFNGLSSTSANASSSHLRETSLLHSHSHNPMTSLNISSSSGYPSLAHSTEEVPTAFGTIVRRATSEGYPSASTIGNAESSHRNYRMRTNPVMSQPNSRPVNTVRQSDAWLQNQLPSRTMSLYHSLDPTPLLASTSSQNQPHMPVAPGLPHIIYHFPWNGASSSRIGNSSGPYSLEDRVISARGGSQSRNMPTAGNLDLVPAASIRNTTQDQTNWNLGSRNASIGPNSQTGTNSGLHPTLVSSWLPHQTPIQYPQPLAETIHTSLFPSTISDSRGQSASFRRQHSGHSFNSQVAHPNRPTLRGTLPTSQIGSANLMRRRNDGILSSPLAMRSLTALGEERSRMLSEIRHALESLRRADGVRFEDVVILDQTLILAGSDLHDRHRDMRLDVDNMSYEELLALEERIGDVCTGLGEEVILKCLKQRKHSSTIFGASIEHEPCCICQEEYVEGEDLGTLVCGHDFHSACIKQWLTHKNLCPICKNTALHT